jgi:hypothetical protein
MGVGEIVSFAVGGLIGAPIGLYAGLKIRRLLRRFDRWLGKKLGVPEDQWPKR